MSIRKRLFLVLAFLSLAIFQLQCLAADIQPEPQPYYDNALGKKTLLYSGGSYALMIGMSNYLGENKGGWDTLNNVPEETERLSHTLRKHGFQIIAKPNLDYISLQTVFKEFFATYGQNSENRLVVYYSGHGWTDKDNKVGYIVPIDAPNEAANITQLRIKALSMPSIVDQVKSLVKARHALLIFDSCFSGMIFKDMGYTTSPTLTNDDMTQYILSTGHSPVRQFITAGDENDRLPTDGTFVKVLTQALEGDYPEIVHGGFLSGIELGDFLKKKLSTYTGNTQHPLSKPIPNPDLDKGDIVFQFDQFKGVNRLELAKPKTDNLLLSQPQQITPAPALTSNSQLLPDAPIYFKPCLADTHNVIVASFPNSANNSEAIDKLQIFRNQFPEFRFKLWTTVARDGQSNEQFAIVAGHGLNQVEAQTLVNRLRTAGVAKDAYSTKQEWGARCIDESANDG
ncbi:caspase family protein [Methylomonas sp. AM2-LC]|uniref:caspase family protein n=1 Tax=Methylomonas sp. AM2-LC TaxID=3153301 RepID=UPI003267AF18